MVGCVQSGVSLENRAVTGKKCRWQVERGMDSFCERLEHFPGVLKTTLNYFFVYEHIFTLCLSFLTPGYFQFLVNMQCRLRAHLGKKDLNPDNYNNHWPNDIVYFL